MCCNDAARMCTNKFPDEAYSAIMFVIAIGATQYFIEDDKCFFSGFQLQDDRLQTLQLCIKERFTVLQRICNSHTHLHCIRIEGKPVCAYHAAASGKHKVDPKSSQKCTFTRHIRTGQNHKPLITEGNTIVDTLTLPDQRMPHVVSFNRFRFTN